MQLICTSLQTDNHTNTSSLNFYSPGALSNANEATIYNSSDYSRVTEFLNINSMLTSKIQTTLPVKCWSPSFVISGQEFKLTDFKHVWCLQHSKVAYYQPIKLWSLTHTCWCGIVVTVTESFVLYKYSHTNWRCITERPSVGFLASAGRNVFSWWHKAVVDRSSFSCVANSSTYPRHDEITRQRST